MALLPIAALAWFGLRLVGAESRAAEQRRGKLAALELREVRLTVDGLVREREAAFRELLADLALTPAAAAELALHEPLISDVLLIDPDGTWRYPAAEQSPAFWRRTAGWRDAGIHLAANDDEPLQRVQSSRAYGAPPRETGWHTWFWNSGLHFLYFERLPDGWMRAVEVNRARFIADVISRLPGDAPALGARLHLLDARGQVLHQWGDLAIVADNRPPAAEMALGAPLESWRLGTFAPASALPGGVPALWLINLLLVLLAFGLAIVGLAAYVGFETRREFREAAQRVSFVNRVSHEPKTPLTNVRLYAELLAEELAELEPPYDGESLMVITSEAQRLTRMIDNVLSFARHQQNKLTVRAQPVVVDDVIDRVVEHFGPALADAGLQVLVELDAALPVAADADAVEQILGNLLSNVEKYAAAGGEVRISSAQSAQSTTVTVADNGPGVPWRERKRIFQPFYRISNRLADGVSGAGIGLAIARDQARLMRGELAFLPSERGAAFQLTLLPPEDALSTSPRRSDEGIDC
jgi:signal transduction histidine kinase